MNLTFRPAVECLDARELPAVVVFSDILVESVVPHPATPPAVASIDGGHDANTRQTRQTSVVVEL